MRTRRHALGLALLVVMTACRSETIWSGIAPIDDGQRLKLAAAVGLCGCTTLQNRRAEPVTLSVSMHEAEVGHATIPGRSQIVVRFDWAGELNDDVYIISVANGRGASLPFISTIGVAETSEWLDCSEKACDFPPLNMDVAIHDRHPGER